MSAPLRAERGGLAPAPTIDLPPTRMTPAQISLTLTADVLRLPHLPAVRLVLAEIVSLHAATAGCCDASDAHFVARLTLSTNTVSRAIQQLHDEGLIVKTVDKSKGFYRTLVPVAAAIAVAAAANPYPQNGGSYPQNGGSPTPKMGSAYPQNGATPTPKMGDTLPPKWGTNTPSNIPVNFHLNPDDAASAAAPGGGEILEVVGWAEISERPASHTEGGAADVATSIPWLEEPAPSARPVLMRESAVASFEAFVLAWTAASHNHPETYAPYAQADLFHYHDALLAWSNGGAKKKHCWVSTIRNSMRRDAEGKGLVKLGPAGVKSTSPILKRVATAEQALAMNEYDANGNRIN